MIYSNSRYAEGLIFKAHDARKDNITIAVLRKGLPETKEFFYYTWVERDRIDLIADKFLGGPDMWWHIMDFNPEIMDPFNIPLGAVLRIPNV